METFKKIAAVMVTIPLWLPILAHILVYYLIANQDKFEKELEQFFGRKETTKREWKRHDRKRKRDH